MSFNGRWHAHLISTINSPYYSSVCLWATLISSTKRKCCCDCCCTVWLQCQRVTVFRFSCLPANRIESYQWHNGNVLFLIYFSGISCGKAAKLGHFSKQCPLRSSPCGNQIIWLQFVSKFLLNTFASQNRYTRFNILTEANNPVNTIDPSTTIHAIPSIPE